MELTPTAIKAGVALAERLYGGKTKKMDYDTIPTTVFTPIEYGTCGLSEEDAVAKYGEENLNTYHVSYQPLEWQFNKYRPEGEFAYQKLICLKTENERVVGYHVLSPNAGEITQGVGIAMKCGATKEAFDACVGIHPTSAEEMTQLKVTR